ncbi:hypothetical protein RM780_11345 [Streptomyces sp. DSM 44917]|uniref:Ricin B lectin domain-containing protein n=1 Tax=Streptomyces boetiae TaxID=3075541 RepID=A0ABU2L7J8_9ACTN|nr:hypothetical protein [Streptomyces sp. DSM 44917]MDT0307555.1 hypothetical protein [Streptomyces sp. DSM 44917]
MLAAQYLFDLSVSGHQLARERDIERQLDGRQPPFTTAITYDTSVPGNWTIVLDRPLTPEEQGTLRAIPVDAQFGQRVWDLLRPLGGRLLHIPVAMDPLPPGYDPFTNPWADASATAFTMALLSDRASQLSILDMRPVNLSCTDPVAETVVEFPPQGEATYPGVVVDLASENPTFLITDDAADQGQPYFSRRRIDLGGGLEPGGLRVEALARGQSCEWEIEARYQDAAQNVDSVTIRNDGQPFFAEAVPDDPEQYWRMELSPDGEPTWTPCHETPSVSTCGQGP